MNTLAVSNNKRLLNLRQFDMATHFYTDTYLFKKLTIRETTLETIEEMIAAILLLLFLQE